MRMLQRIAAAVIAAVCMMQMPAAADTAVTAPFFEASFLQLWYCESWTPEQWQTELSAMKDAGFRAVILQSSADITVQQEQTSIRTAYPTELFSGGSGNALGNALDAAKTLGMQVYIGTLSDSRWWDYGWGIPDADFSAWSEENAQRNAAMIREIWSLYGSSRGEQIAGFYYNNEIWNNDAACDGSDGGAYAEIIGSNLGACVEAVNACCQEKPLLVSPFYNTDLSSAGAYADYLASIAEQAHLRAYDIIAPQDGGGREYDSDTILEWNSSVRYAVEDRVQFWVNNETFDKSMQPIDMETLRQHYLATDCAKKHILFSWNHYYRKTPYDVQFPALLQKMTGDVNADGVCSMADAVNMIHWLMHDRIAVANWRAGDLDNNGKWNAADLSLLKRLLLTAQV